MVNHHHQQPTQVYCRTKTSPTDLQTLLCCAGQVYVLPTNFIILPLDRVIGLSLLALSLVTHFVTLVVHRLSLIRTTEPAQVHLFFSILITIPSTRVCSLIQEDRFLSFNVPPIIICPMASWARWVCFPSASWVCFPGTSLFSRLSRRQVSGQCVIPGRMQWLYIFILSYAGS